MKDDSVAESSTPDPEIESFSLIPPPVPTAPSTPPEPAPESIDPELTAEEEEAIRIAAEEQVKMLQQLSEEFDARCQERHEMGEKKYGPGTWLGVDTLEMALEELIDLANYTRFTFVRIRMLQEALDTDRATARPQSGNELMGKDAFTSGVRGLQ